MTIEQFNQTQWSAGMTAIYHGDNTAYPVLAVDFSEMIVGLKGVQGSSGEVYWARCENVTIANEKGQQ